MKRIRIGKDLLVRWPIITNGEPASLEGRDIRLELVPPSCERVVIPYTIAGNIVVVRISPELQHSVGRYSLTLWENYGEEGQTVVDSCCAFVLVSNSSAESDGVDPDVEVETVELESGELSFTLVGYRKMEVDDVLSTTSENPVQNKVVAGALSQKVDKVDGKQLTTEDFTAALKQKLESLSNYDDTQIKELVAALRNDFNTLVSGDTSAAIDNYNEIIAFLSNISDATSLEDIIAGVKALIPTKTSDLNNDSGFITEHQPLKTINGQSIVGEGNIEIKGGSGASVDVDSELSTTSENPVQNKTITVELNKKGTYSKPAVGIPKSDLESSVQESLSKANTAAQKADIPTKISDLDNDAGSISYLGIEYTLSDSDKVVSDVNEWAAISAPLTQRERAIVSGSGYYVVCGTSGDVAYSADANEWTKITPFTTGVLTSIAYGKGRFLAIDSLGAVWISYKNPYSWEQVDVTFDVILEAVIYANNRFIIVGASGLFAESNNGLVWEVGNIDSVDKYSLTFGEGKYIAAGLNGSIFESTDGETWVDNSDSTFTQSIRTVAYGNGLFVCGGQTGAIRYSADGEVWTTATTNSTSTISYIRGIAYSNGRFYACMYTSAGKGEIWVSDDAATWTVQFTSNGRLWAIMANDNILLSTGDSGAIYKLDLAVEWQDSEPEMVEGKYLWQRVSAGLTDGSTVYGENVCLINSTKFAAKQDAISDLATIREGAAKGATALQEHQSLEGYAKTADLATVATSGSYADLSDKPTIPAEQVNADWNATSGKAQILNKPTIPTVPNDVSAFNNDAGYITDETTFKNSAAYGIDSDDITNWDGKISGDGTILKVVKVAALPSSPDANTLYIIA